MNGLKCIRKRCNLSMGDLSDIMDISRQAISAWENGQKKIPENRRQELADIFKIDIKYLTELSKEVEEEILAMPLYRYWGYGKESFRFERGIEKSDGTFFSDNKKTLDEQYLNTRAEMREVMDHVEDAIYYKNDLDFKADQIVSIKRGCSIFEKTTLLLKEMNNKDTSNKMPYYFELRNILDAVLIAQEVLDINDLDPNEDKYGTDYDMSYGNDMSMIIELSEYLKAHWEKRKISK